MAHGSSLFLRIFKSFRNSSIFIRIGGMGYDDAAHTSLQLYMAVAYYPIRNKMLPQFLVGMQDSTNGNVSPPRPLSASLAI